MKHSCILIMVFMLNCSFGVGMEAPLQPESPIKAQIRQAFHAFGMQPRAEEYSLLAEKKPQTPQESEPRWKVTNNRIEFTCDIANNADLSEFAAYCCAAYVKNHSSCICQVAHSAFAAATILCTPAVILLSPNSFSGHTISICTMVAVLFATGKWDLVNKATREVDKRLTRWAFAVACQKLIEQGNFKPIATYYAFAKLIKHEPVGQEAQASIIIESLNRNRKSIECIIRSNSVEARIEERPKLDDKNKPIKLASVFYPEQ
ncbi:hypothetical protein BH09DEP1_BH09DEP1_3730 [soil metagenome]